MSTANQNAGYLTTHVLDTANGTPAADLTIQLFKLDGSSRTLLKKIQTNSDGRADAPMLKGEEFEIGTYELIFNVGDYYNRDEPISFLSEVPVRFGITEADEHYHVPLLVSPFGYSTYRGS